MSSQSRLSSREIASYAGACLKLAFDAAARGLDIHKVEASLCEDGHTIALTLEDPKAGDFITASFVVDEKINDAEFDQRKFCEGFWET
jgi:hypothetical protein